MNKNKKIIIVVVILVMFITGLIGGYFGVLSFREKQIKETYEKNPSIENLANLCDSLYSSKDMQYLYYVEKLVQDPAIDNYHSNLFPEGDKNIYYDILIAKIFNVCIQNKNIDEFCKAVCKFYPMMKSKERFCVVSAMLEECDNELISLNHDKIIEAFWAVYNNHIIRLDILTVLQGYYYSVKISNIHKSLEVSELFNSYKNTLSLSKEEQENYQQLKEKYIVCWDLLLE